MRQESNLEQAAVDMARRAGYIARKVTYAGRRGAPDRWFFGPRGNLVIVEFKDRRGALSPAQKKEISMLLRRGYQVWIIDNLEDFESVIDQANPVRPELSRIREANIALLGSYYDVTNV